MIRRDLDIGWDIGKGIGKGIGKDIVKRNRLSKRPILTRPREHMVTKAR